MLVMEIDFSQNYEHRNIVADTKHNGHARPQTAIVTMRCVFHDKENEMKRHVVSKRSWTNVLKHGASVSGLALQRMIDHVRTKYDGVWDSIRAIVVLHDGSRSEFHCVRGCACTPS